LSLGHENGNVSLHVDPYALIHPVYNGIVLDSVLAVNSCLVWSPDRALAFTTWSG
jgi:hypothetical protein